ncbi:metalloregulator ArsR/SmtB family transcription factor [Photobacterium toruni]|uniref:Metalloregulator ArsR/SmtB family transcription factor n=1 Tax=Photobacterium toruni TaxID=1935446 RepID=A0A1T4T7E2_9GAMM|nr:metalloregulator ArsR/SmtB family transcription factor [Photobacterium toruni]MEC6817069.1 metalloregulator ArsR/SmtB family transcription factor [Photobacterium toruni]MEC6831541.1 metalloregulator ArsR/SmtB family transcription factor [Photobacterium toruni]SKA36098.1 Transcriptional repressor SdpR [Photobacterium toruni]
MKRILFLCTGNSARSQLAEALMRHMCRDSEATIGKFEIMSAGMAPEIVDPRVYEVLNYHNVNSDNLTSLLAASLQNQHFDVVITLCDKASKECALFPDSDALIHWDFKDPKPLSGSQGFYDVFDGLKAKIALFLMLNGDHQSDTIGAVELFKIMSDSLRLRILMLIHDEIALSVGDLTKALQVSQPKVSRHLALLRDSGVLQDHREGVWIFYHFPSDLPQWICHTLETVRNGQPALINQEKIRLSTIKNRKKPQLINIITK